MPSRSKVASLPINVRQWLDRTLRENNFSGYALLTEELRTRGYHVSRSALQRYGQAFERRLAALQLAAEQARAVVEAAPDETGSINEALVRLVQEHLLKLLLSEEGSFDLAKVARAVSEMGRATVTQRKWQEEVRERAEQAANTAAWIATKGGLSAKAVGQLREQILGIAA